MDRSESAVELSAERKLDDLLGNADEKPLPVRLADLGSLQDDERNAEIVSKEKVARFNDRLQQQMLKQLREEHQLRKRFMPYVFWLVVGVLIASVVLLSAAGVCNACGLVFLTDKVLITLLTATVADVLGILYIAMRWLYPQHSSADSE